MGAVGASPTRAAGGRACARIGTGRASARIGAGRACARIGAGRAAGRYYRRRNRTPSRTSGAERKRLDGPLILARTMCDTLRISRGFGLALLIFGLGTSIARGMDHVTFQRG